MKMFIPTIGTKLQLTKRWKFTLHAERRNKSIFEKMAIPVDLGMARLRDYYLRNGRITQEVYDNNPDKFEIELEKGIVLVIDRIYIRNGAGDYDSITFRVPKKVGNPKNLEGARFWASLSDVNEMYFNLYEEDRT